MCKINYISEDENINKEVEEKAIENVKEELTNGFNTSNIDSGKNVVIGQKHSTIAITSTENQKKEKTSNSNSTTIDLWDCEAKIKDEYGIPKNKSLYILKIDVKQEGLKIPKIAYEVYYPLFGDNLIKLNLTVCKDSKIEISIPVVLTDDIDKINPASEYYNNICYTYTSEYGTDISLSDRKNNFVNNNLTVCEEDCNFNGYNYTTEKTSCFCNVKTEQTTKIRDISFNRNKLYDSFTNIKNIVNINVLKCYNLIFNLNAYKHNYAYLIMIGIIVLYIIALFIFCFREYYFLEKILDIIAYFKLNINLVKKFLERKKREQQKKKNKNIILKKIVDNKKGKKDDLNLPLRINSNFSKLITENKLSDKEIQYLDKNDNSNSIISNPNKKNKRNFKNIFATNNKISFKNKILKKNNNNRTKNRKSIILNKKEYPYNMNESQMYEFFLKINTNSDFELNDLSYNNAIKIDKRTYCQYYLSLIRTKHLFFFSFCPTFDYNSQIIKIFLFFF